MDFKTNDLWLMQGDCLERMKEIKSGSVDMILTDPPYGMTACKWDSIIPLTWHIKENGKTLYLSDALICGYSFAYFEQNKKAGMWEQLKRIIKPNGAIVMTASQPFTTTLISSNMKMLKYCLVWEKTSSSNPQHANFQPLKIHEDILIFTTGGTAAGSKTPCTFNKQMSDGAAYHKGFTTSGGGVTSKGFNGAIVSKPDGKKNPTSVIKIPNPKSKKTLIPTQKPVALMEYLIKTYTNEGETVLDFTMGSGTTGVAAIDLGRKFIGIELDKGYFEIAKNRIINAKDGE